MLNFIALAQGNHAADLLASSRVLRSFVVAFPPHLAKCGPGTVRSGSTCESRCLLAQYCIDSCFHIQPAPVRPKEGASCCTRWFKSTEICLLFVDRALSFQAFGQVRGRAEKCTRASTRQIASSAKDQPACSYHLRKHGRARTRIHGTKASGVSLNFLFCKSFSFWDGSSKLKWNGCKSLQICSCCFHPFQGVHGAVAR